MQELRRLYHRRSLAEAQRDLAAWLARWQGRYPKLTDWVEENIGSTLSFYRLPRQHHKHLKSSNMLERLNEELRRRTYVAQPQSSSGEPRGADDTTPVRQRPRTQPACGRALRRRTTLPHAAPDRRPSHHGAS
jgi:hypothetical protein